MNIEAKLEFYSIIEEVLNSKEFQRRKKFMHHGDISVYAHSLNVAKVSYVLAKKMHIDYKSATIAAILHDFYTEPWKEVKEKKPLFKKHGFTHAKISLDNSRKHFPTLMNKKVENAILRHMFPLNLIPPRYIESWVVTLADKYVAMNDVRVEVPTPTFRRVLVNE